MGGSLGSSPHPLKRAAPCWTNALLQRDLISFVFVDEASAEKERLEEKQRAARKERAKNDEEWSTRWENAQQHVRSNGARVSLLLLTRCRDVGVLGLT